MATGSKTKDMPTSIMHGKTLICGWSVINRGWVGLKNNGLFLLSLAIWVRTSPLTLTGKHQDQTKNFFNYQILSHPPQPILGSSRKKNLQGLAS